MKKYLWVRMSEFQYADEMAQFMFISNEDASQAYTRCVEDEVSRGGFRSNAWGAARWIDNYAVTEMTADGLASARDALREAYSEWVERCCHATLSASKRKLLRQLSLYEPQPVDA